MGFLTIDKKVLTRHKLNVPNYVIKELYFDFFARIVQDEANYNLETSKIKDAIARIALYGPVRES